MIRTLVSLFIFPGFLFAILFSLALEFVDRKLYARLQHRKGPPWFQPLADMIKLCAKEDIVPREASRRFFVYAPIFSLASAMTAFLYIPLWRAHSLHSFYGDIIVVLYLLTIPTLTFFIGGWYSTSLYARLGAVRAITQMFAYEVPLFIGLLSPMLLANTWSISEAALFYHGRPWLWAANAIGFIVALVALLGKLEKTPFDIPEAETEIVAGTFTEYSGRLLAFFRMTLDIELLAGASLLAAIFFPFGLGLPAAVAFVVYVAKVLFIVALLSVCRSIFARLRIDQMVQFCWKFLAPLALVQLVIDLCLKKVIY